MGIKKGVRIIASKPHPSPSARRILMGRSVQSSANNSSQNHSTGSGHSLSSPSRKTSSSTCFAPPPTSSLCSAPSPPQNPGSISIPSTRSSLKPSSSSSFSRSSPINNNGASNLPKPPTKRPAPFRVGTLKKTLTAASSFPAYGVLVGTQTSLASRRSGVVFIRGLVSSPM